VTAANVRVRLSVRSKTKTQFQKI